MAENPALSAPGIAGVGQISIPVRDLSRAVTFYRDALGLRFLFEAPPSMAFFDCGGTRLLLGVPEKEDDEGSSILYFRVPDIDHGHQALIARGATSVREPHFVAKLESHDLWLSFFRDSEGNVMALMSERDHGTSATDEHGATRMNEDRRGIKKGSTRGSIGIGKDRQASEESW